MSERFNKTHNLNLNLNFITTKFSKKYRHTVVTKTNVIINKAVQFRPPISPKTHQNTRENIAKTS